MRDGTPGTLGKEMKAIAQIGVQICVTPQDDIWIKNQNGTTYIDDRSSFFIVTEGHLEDGHMFFGVYGRVIDGSERYKGLICSLISRLSGDDWRIKNSSQANFKVGVSPVYVNHEHSFHHPEGTQIDGFPVIGRFGRIETVE